MYSRWSLRAEVGELLSRDILSEVYYWLYILSRHLSVSQLDKTVTKNRSELKWTMFHGYTNNRKNSSTVTSRDYYSQGLHDQRGEAILVSLQQNNNNASQSLEHQTQVFVPYQPAAASYYDYSNQTQAAALSPLQNYGTYQAFVSPTLGNIPQSQLISNHGNALQNIQSSLLSQQALHNAIRTQQVKQSALLAQQQHQQPIQTAYQQQQQGQSLTQTGASSNLYSKNYDYSSQAAAQFSHADLQKELKEKIRANILEQLTPKSSPSSGTCSRIPTPQSNMSEVREVAATRSSPVDDQLSPAILEAAKKRTKRTRSQEDGIGGKKQRFDNGGLYADGKDLHQIPVVIPSGDGRSPSKDTCQLITQAIVNYFIKNQQTNEVYTKKMQLRDALYTIIQDSGLYIVGSSMSGFGTIKSDMDLCLMISQQGIDQKREATDLLYAIQRALYKCSFVKNLEVIRAKVPILRFRDTLSDVECDLNVNNLVGIRNTHLLKHYALLDWRVRPLGLFIKYWARFHDINDARNMTISSYSLALMLIHYLQCGCSPPVLPSLQNLCPETFKASMDVRSLRPVVISYTTENRQSVGELFLGFLEYYTHKFDYRKDALSVRLGTRLPIYVVQRQTVTQGKQWNCLCVEEPFDMSNTARSVYNPDTFRRIQRVFRGSLMKLSQKRDTKVILTKRF